MMRYAAGAKSSYSPRKTIFSKNMSWSEGDSAASRKVHRFEDMKYGAAFPRDIMFEEGTQWSRDRGREKIILHLQDELPMVLDYARGLLPAIRDYADLADVYLNINGYDVLGSELGQSDRDYANSLGKRKPALPQRELLAAVNQMSSLVPSLAQKAAEDQMESGGSVR